MNDLPCVAPTGPGMYPTRGGGEAEVCCCGDGHCLGLVDGRSRAWDVDGSHAYGAKQLDIIGPRLRPLPMDPADVIAEFVRLFEAGEVEYQWKHSNIWCAASTKLLCRYRLKPKPTPLTAPPTDWPEPVRQAAIEAAKEAGVVFAEVGP